MCQRTQAEIVLEAVRYAKDEVDDLFNTNRYISGVLFEARHHMEKAEMYVERLIRNCDRR